MKLAVLSSDIYLSPDEVYDTYVEFNTNYYSGIEIFTTLYSIKPDFEIHIKQCLE